MLCYFNYLPKENDFSRRKMQKFVHEKSIEFSMSLYYENKIRKGHPQSSITLGKRSNLFLIYLNITSLTI